MISSLLDLIYPPVCQICNRLQPTFTSLCPHCLNSISRFKHPCCRICSLPIETLEAGESCSACKTDPPPFVSVVAAAPFEDPLRHWIHRLKYHHERNLSLSLALLLEHLCPLKHSRSNACLIPVPLHLRQLKRRGFNQAHLIAKTLGKMWKIPVLTHGLKRIVDTPPQANLNREERLKNVQNAFRASMPLNGKNVILVDDVMTTGATLRACASIIQKANASDVYVVTVARA